MLLFHYLNSKLRPNLGTKEIVIRDLLDIVCYPAMVHSDLAPVQPKNTFIHFLYLGSRSGAT